METLTTEPAEDLHEATRAWLAEPENHYAAQDACADLYGSSSWATMGELARQNARFRWAREERAIAEFCVRCEGDRVVALTSAHEPGGYRPCPDCRPGNPSGGRSGN